MSTVNGRRLNLKFEDHRVLTSFRRYKSIMGAFRTKLPSVVDLRPGCSPVENQGDEGSCSAHAAAACVEYLQIQELKTGSGPQIYDPSTFARVSRNMIYYGEREIEGDVSTDAGATTLLDACNTLTNIGVCRESLWPYGQATLFTAPDAAAMADAVLHKVQNFYGLTPGYQIKHCLWSGFPIMFGFQVFESFMSDEVSATGEWNGPTDPSEAIVGGHANCIVGYDDARQCFIVKNSWSESWGIDGYWHMGYDFADSQYVDDFYTLRLMPSKNP